MRPYEATFIFQTNPDALESGKQAVSEILTKASIKTTSEDDIGERKLAYKINKQESGHYILYEIESEPSKIHEIMGFFSPHGISSKLRYIDYLNENTRIRLENGQNKIIV